jgi:hypothetical protein
VILNEIVGPEPTQLVKLCRICWNSARWQRPTGEASILENNSYVARQGFGHEEWLFNLGYLVNGKHYAFVQPVNKGYKNVSGKKLRLILYALTPPPVQPVVVSEIEECEVISVSEARKIVETYRKRGWLQEMAHQVKSLGRSRLDVKGKPNSLFNVRFSAERVKHYDPYVPLPKRLTPSLRRYQLLNIPKELQLLLDNPKEVRRLQVAVPKASAVSPKRKSELARTRAACKGTVYDPVHDRIQNRLDEILRRRYGTKAVLYEHEHVDLGLTYAVEGHPRVAFFDVKTDSTVKQSVRAAIGQLLEYSCYPSRSAAHELIVVGWAAPDPEDVQYLRHLNEEFGLPLGYWRFDIEKEIVVERIGVAGPEL